MNRIFINIFFLIFFFIYYRENIYCCCCFQCANIETKEEKDERLRNEQIKRENALRNKLFNIICSHVGQCCIKFKENNVLRGVLNEDSICDDLKEMAIDSILSPKDKDTQIADDVYVKDNNFFIKHEGVGIEVKFYIILELKVPEYTYRVCVFGRDLPSKLGIRKYGEPIIFYYSDDENFFKLKKDKIIGDGDKPVNNFMEDTFDCLKCTYISDNCFCIDFYKVITGYH